MRWTERQREMLAALGHRVFEAPGSDDLMTVGGEPDEDPAGPSTSSKPTAAEPPATTVQPAAPAIARAVVPITRADVAALDWPQLRAAVAGCRACALCESRTQTVFGVGHERARLMIVGEAPGENEDLQGEPFVGQSGKLLDRMLEAIGLTRAAEVDASAEAAERQVFIANTIKCRPPRNRNPEPAETAQCAPFLARQIELVQPKLILAMGRFAAQSLLATEEPIGKLRGRVHRWRDTPVVVTYHPAYLLRTLADKARAWDDLVLAASMLEK
jgi:uracil-DNA glycosylase